MPPAGGNKTPRNFKRLLGHSGLGKIISFDDFVEMEMELFNKWLELWRKAFRRDRGGKQICRG